VSRARWQGRRRVGGEATGVGAAAAVRRVALAAPAVRRHPLWAVLVAVGALVGTITLVPEASGAWGTSGARPVLPGQESTDGSDRDGELDLDIDVQRADEVSVEQAFGDLTDNVQAQREQLEGAQQRVAEADQAVIVAQGRVAEVQARIDVLVSQSDDVVVRAFTAPPSETAIDALSTESASDAAVRLTVLDMQADADASVLADLDDAQNELEELQAAERDAVAAAEERRNEAQGALDDMRAAVSQEVEFTLEVEERLNHQLGEIAALEESDPELAAQLRSQQEALAAQIAVTQQRIQEENLLEEYGVDPDQIGPDGPAGIQPVSGGVVAVSCPSGGSVEVAGAIAREVQGLLNLAYNQGISSICGYGYRDPSEQIALRRQHCGSSDYAIYQMPASSCSPPTAIPGSSNHEQGLAIDFTSGGRTIGCSGSVYRFLQGNAADYSLYPYSAECWHWSTDGT
jgi:peptidoglycan hydrolase CwlO-like protein